MYNSFIAAKGMLPHELTCVELVSACAQDRSDSGLWREFLRRYGPCINRFIRAASVKPGAGLKARSSEPFSSEELRDLFQATILCLLRSDCAVMRRFCGATEAEWLSYLAATVGFVVQNAARGRGRFKRLGREIAEFTRLGSAGPHRNCLDYIDSERKILAGEVKTLYESIIKNEPSPRLERDMLIFQLYYLHDLSLGEIAQGKGIDLSRSGVRDVLHRLTGQVQRLVQRERFYTARVDPGASRRDYPGRLLTTKR